jgi:hypothetical protein
VTLLYLYISLYLILLFNIKCAHVNNLQDYFIGLSKENLYSAKQQSDRIALLAVYIPIIREEVAAYVEIWNKHKIRKQKERPNVVPGKPVFNYHFSHTKGVENCGRPIDPELVKAIQAETAHFSKYFNLVIMCALLVLVAYALTITNQ